MDRAHVSQHLRDLEPLLDDLPPLLSLVILANGSGLAVAHPMLESAHRGTFAEQEAALRLVRACLVDLAANFEARIELIIRASAQDRDVHTVIESL